MPEMADGRGDQERRDLHRPYFFLSYAHSGLPHANSHHDHLVANFFNDLTAAVRRCSSRPPDSVAGFFDQQAPVDSDWMESLIGALSSAEVFVPLYSAAYVSGSWSGREWTCFHRRMEWAGLPDPMLRFVPVLWAPLEGGQDPPGLAAALALGSGERGYTENGLRALMTIGSYYRSYETLVNALAQRIVVLVEGSPLEPSVVPDIDKIESAFPAGPRHTIFAIETAAPSIQWRPFPRQKLPSVEYVRQVAEWHGFRTEVSPVMTVGGLARLRPGLIMIDPGFIANDEGRQALKSAIYRLPRWVLPLPILEQPGDTRIEALARQVTDMLYEANVLVTVRHRQAALGVSSLKDFEDLIPELVLEAERQYLQHRSARVSSPPSATRPSLRRSIRPDAVALPPDPSQEAPDA